MHYGYDGGLDSLTDHYEKFLSKEFGWKKSNGPVVIAKQPAPAPKADATLKYGPHATKEGRVPGKQYCTKLLYEMGLLFS